MAAFNDKQQKMRSQIVTRMEETKHRDKSSSKVEQTGSKDELNLMRRQLEAQDTLIKSMKKELDCVKEDN